MLRRLFKLHLWAHCRNNGKAIRLAGTLSGLTFCVIAVPLLTYEYFQSKSAKEASRSNHIRIAKDLLEDYKIIRNFSINSACHALDRHLEQFQPVLRKLHENPQWTPETKEECHLMEEYTTALSGVYLIVCALSFEKDKSVLESVWCRYGHKVKSLAANAYIQEQMKQEGDGYNEFNKLVELFKQIECWKNGSDGSD